MKNLRNMFPAAFVALPLRVFRFSAFALAFGLAASSASAIVQISGDWSSNSGQLTFTQAVSYTITTAGNFNTLTFENWISDAQAENRETAYFHSDRIDLSYTLTRNGADSQGVFQVYSVSSGWLFDQLDRRKASGYLQVSPSGTGGGYDVQAGDIITIHAQTLAQTDSGGGSLSNVPASFSGQSYLLGAPTGSTVSGTFLSGPTTVPEPSTYAALLGVSALCFAAVRRRRR